MSDLRVNTISASDGTSPVTLTKQEATKHYVNYDAVNQTTDSSLNQSSLTDQTTGEFLSSFVTSFSGATNKVHQVSVYNSVNDGTNRSSDEARGGVAGNIGAVSSDGALLAPSASSVQFYAVYSGGSSASLNAGRTDTSANFCSSIGDLA
jgi:hypothetical protein